MLRSLLATESPVGDMIRRVGQTFATRLLLILISLVSSVIIARTLGPVGRGEYGVAATVAIIGAQLAMLGMHASNTFQLAKEPGKLPALLGNSLLVSVTAGSVGGALVLLFNLSGSLSSLNGLLLWMAALAVPIYAASGLLQNLFLGLYDTARFNRIDIVSNSLNLFALVGLVLFGLQNPSTVYGASLVVAISISVLMTTWLVREGGPVVLSASLFRENLGFSLRTYVSTLIMLVALRMDLLLVEHYRGAEAAGHFAIAATLAELLGMLAVVTGSILFPRLSAEPDARARWHLASWTAVVIGAVILVAGLCSMPLAEPVLVTLFGADYRPSVAPYLWLVPGVVCISANAILMNYFAAEGMPPVVFVAPLTALVTKLVLGVQLIPAQGMVGAALASSVSYCMMLLVSLGYLAWRRRPELSLES